MHVMNSFVDICVYVYISYSTQNYLMLHYNAMIMTILSTIVVVVVVVVVKSK